MAMITWEVCSSDFFPPEFSLYWCNIISMWLLLALWWQVLRGAETGCASSTLNHLIYLYTYCTPGADFDHCLSQHLTATYGDVTSSIPSSSSLHDLEAGPGEGKEALSFDDEGDVPSSPSTPPSTPHAFHTCASYTMLSIAEHLKKRLSSSSSASFSCLSDNKDGGLPKHITVTQQAFEDACADVFARALAPVDLCLESNGMATSEIDEVVMVGGTTRIPKVREMLRVHLQVASLNTHIDPDITVAVGAACVVD